ncbi:hypothetical protein [Microbulbifer sp.]|uniref:hypothetical protein n=1 Tax=Microbulbifer sp. TaxID=1908541 RepID=UPI0025838500|nr:hypothetical protein [Microbulbifer sp.]
MPISQSVGLPVLGAIFRGKGLWESTVVISAMLMFSGMTVYHAGLGFYPDPFTLIISVPWKDIDPEKLEAYRKDKTTGCGSMDHLLWEVPEGWEEIKEWQATKALEEAKAAA